MAEDAKGRRRSSVFGKLMNAFKSSNDESRPNGDGGNGPEPKTTTADSRTAAEAAPTVPPKDEDKVAAASTSRSGRTYSVAGKSALITGAGSGINLSFARLLLSKGCNVLIADLSLRPEAQELIDVHSKDDAAPKAAFVRTDVTNWADLRNMFDVAYSTFGSLDIVCPGAGVFEPHWSNFWHPPGSAEGKDAMDAGHYATLDINITHPIRTTQLAIAYFLNPPKGDKVSVEAPKRIVHISSIAGQTFALPVPLYFASKWAISGFVRSMAGLDAKLGIKVAAVAPGVVKTPLFTEHPEKLSMVDQENGTWVTPEEVAEAMLACVEDGTIASGTVLEVGSKYTRAVQPFNDPGPMGRPGIRTNMGHKVDEVYEWLSGENWGRAGT